MLAVGPTNSFLSKTRRCVHLLFNSGKMHVDGPHAGSLSHEQVKAWKKSRKLHKDSFSRTSPQEKASDRNITRKHQHPSMPKEKRRDRGPMHAAALPLHCMPACRPEAAQRSFLSATTKLRSDLACRRKALCGYMSQILFLAWAPKQFFLTSGNEWKSSNSFQLILTSFNCFATWEISVPNQVFSSC